MKLIVQIKVQVEAADYNAPSLIPDLVNKLNLIEKEIFSDYIIDSQLEALMSERVKGGILTVKYVPLTQEFFSIVEYNVERRLPQRQKVS